VEADNITLEEAVHLGAADTEFFNRYFLSKTFRDPSPQFHRDSDAIIEAPYNRYVNIEMFRGSAKTSRLRAFLLKRVSYAISHTIVIVGKSQPHSIYTIEWLMKQILFNNTLRAFGLQKGNKWAPGSGELEVYHSVAGYTIRLLAYGITGSIRGVNIDDYRPDLILMDDINDEETTGTPDARAKTEDLVFGALQNSLAPPNEAPNAKMINICTPLNREDISQKNKQSKLWACSSYGCFDEEGNSRWEERFPTKFLQEQKQDMIDKNRLSIWMREMECKLISTETSSFVIDRLQYYDFIPDGGITFMAIDPVPPPSDRALERGLMGNDWEVLAVIKVHKTGVYVCEYVKNRGHDPEWTIAEFFRLVEFWRPLRVRVETVNYQRTLKWLLEKAMQARRRYVTINSSDGRKGDQRKKSYRIIDGISGPLNNGKLFVRRDMTDLISQIAEYPTVVHDDVIEAVAEAINESKAGTLSLLDGSSMLEELDAEVEDLPNWRMCP